MKTCLYNYPTKLETSVIQSYVDFPLYYVFDDKRQNRLKTVDLIFISDTCIFHVFVQQVLQVLLLVVVELSLQSQQDVFIQQHPDQMEGACEKTQN